jgi:hypothetical protein
MLQTPHRKENFMAYYQDPIARHQEKERLRLQEIAESVRTGIFYYDRGQKREALPHFEHAARLGDSKSVRMAIEIRGDLGMTTANWL